MHVIVSSLSASVARTVRMIALCVTVSMGAWLSTYGAVEVANVVATQREGTKLLDITYDVSSTVANAVTVSVQILNGADTLVATNLTGDVGPGVSTGTGKQIVWNAGADWNSQLARGLNVRVVASDGTAVSLLPVPAGMALVPMGVNTGVDPDFGSYSLSNTMPLYVDSCEVTRTLWNRVAIWAAAHGYTNDWPMNTNCVLSGGSNFPVTSVNWYEAVTWCNARSEMEGLRPSYYMPDNRVYRGQSGASALRFNALFDGYRLPTDIEWEYAARGGLAGHRYPWGDAIDASMASYGGVSMTNVGHFAANGFGLYDVGGSVHEWCFDACGSSSRSLRGGAVGSRPGGYGIDESFIKCGYHYSDVYHPNPEVDAYNNCGFRTVRRAGQ